MISKYNIKNSYIYSNPELEQEEFFSSTNFHEIEYEISHLKTLSHSEHRNIARRMYSKIRERISTITDLKEKSELKRLAHLINMKLKTL